MSVDEMLARTMSASSLLTKREIFCLVAAVAVAAAVSEKSFRDGDGTPLDGRRRHIPYLATFWLPPLMLIFALLPCFGLLSFRHVLSVLFSVLVSVCVYDALLLTALPLLRRVVSAQACAVLWLLPNYLVLLANLNQMKLDRPRWVVHLPVMAVQAACALWAAGFCAVLVWKIAGHLRFRRALLRRARPAEDPEYLTLWRKVQTDAGFPSAPYRLVVSPAAATPLSIGLFPGALRVVLPERAYTAEELELVLRHELVHISRRDNVTKFFLVFCTALCWFNPLTWLAMDRSAQDIELGCDETVLLDADEGTRRRYAELLLSAAGDGWGFTTCLSASARSLRYRLRSVLHPAAERRSAAALVGVLIFALLSTGGWPALVADSGAGRDLLFPTGRPEDYTVQRVAWREDWESTEYTCADGAALTGLLGDLELGELDGNYATRSLGLPRGKDGGLIVEYAGPGGSYTAVLEDHYLELFPDAASAPVLSDRVYHLREPADWTAVFSLLEAAPG